MFDYHDEAGKSKCYASYTGANTPDADGMEYRTNISFFYPELNESSVIQNLKLTDMVIEFYQFPPIPSYIKPCGLLSL
jgi:hypothetical protein